LDLIAIELELEPVTCAYDLCKNSTELMVTSPLRFGLSPITGPLQFKLGPVDNQFRSVLDAVWTGFSHKIDYYLLENMLSI
jgi:hypothetical protein